MQFEFKPKDVEVPKGRERVIASMKTTLTARFNACARLTWRKNLTFFISTTLSLGLILIPLVDLAHIPNALQNEHGESASNAMQIFLAVALLVYSTIIGTARYDIRSEQLNDCGDKIKNLIRQLRIEPEPKPGEKDEVLEKYQNDYAKIIDDVENHIRIDYKLAQIQLDDIYTLTVECRLKLWFEIIFMNVIQYTPIALLFFIEFLFITDMFGATHILIPYLNGSHLAVVTTSK